MKKIMIPQILAFIKIIIIITLICALISLTIIAAKVGTVPVLIAMLALYLVIFLSIERTMQSFIEPTKAKIFVKNLKKEGRRDEISYMFSRARKYINIVSGSLSSDVYGNSEVINSLKAAIVDREVQVEIITEREVNPNVMQSITDFIKSNKIILHKLDNGYITRHFIVIDDKDVRVEVRHEPEEEEIRAYYFYSYKRLGIKTKRKFEEIKRDILKAQ